MEGNERYSQEQILSVASVEMGANMILTPGEQIAQRIYRALPYVDHVEVQKRFPTTLKMVITESQPVAVITGAASAWIVDAKGKLLEQADETQAQEYTKVTGLELLEPEQGAQAQTTPENQAQLDGLTAMTTALASCGLMEGMTSIDVSSKTEIVMVYDGRLTVKVLNNVDFDRKLPLVPAARLVFSVPVALALHLGAVVVCPPAGVGTAAAERPGVSLG